MPARKETKKKSTRIVLVVTLAVMGLAAGALILIKIQHPSTAKILASAPDPVTATEAQTVDFVASDRFASLSSEAKQAYLEQARQAHESNPRPLLPTVRSSSSSTSNPTADSGPGSGMNPSSTAYQITKEQRDKAFQNILPVLNKVINQRLDAYEKMDPQAKHAQLDLFINRIQQMQSNKPDGFDPDRFKQFLENVDPYTRAKMRKNLPALEQRMHERGLSLPWKPSMWQK